MKRITTILMTVVLSLALTSCGKVTYTKEFSYLPSQKEMTLKNFNKPTEDKMGTAIYILKNKKSEDVLNEYEKQLKKDEWKITEDKKPNLIKAEKGEHKVIIIPTQNDQDVQLTIVSK